MSSRLEKRSELNDQLLESVGKGEACFTGVEFRVGVGGRKIKMGTGGVYGYINMYIYIYYIYISI